MAVVESLIAFSKSSPGAAGAINPYLTIEKHGGVIRPDYADEIDALENERGLDASNLRHQHVGERHLRPWLKNVVVAAQNQLYPQRQQPQPIPNGYNYNPAGSIQQPMGSVRVGPTTSDFYGSPTPPQPVPAPIYETPNAQQQYVRPMSSNYNLEDLSCSSLIVDIKRNYGSRMVASSISVIIRRVSSKARVWSHSMLFLTSPKIAVLMLDFECSN
ncbi:unnamed protein product [Sphagnum jensenii]|uniref:Uncharacterized protein n=1 Tax=Sphagnum jensenii TaxID=128206 RepID=A0ABP0VJP2_9BRYO